MARAILRSSLSVMMVAVIFMAPPIISPPAADRAQGEAEDEDDQREPAQLAAAVAESRCRRRSPDGAGPGTAAPAPSSIHPSQKKPSGSSSDAQHLRDHPVACAERTSKGCGRHPAARWAAGSARWRTSRPRPRAPPGADRYRPCGTPGKISRSSSHCSSGHAELHAALVRDARESPWKTPAPPPAPAAETRSRPAARDPDIEQHPLGIDRRADADEGAERAQERRRHEVRQAGIHAVIDRPPGSGRTRAPAGSSAA